MAISAELSFKFTFPLNSRTVKHRFKTAISQLAIHAKLLVMQTISLRLTAVFQKVPEGYIGYVEELPGANTQGATLDETRENLKEAVELVLEANRQLAEESLEGADVIREPLLLNAA